MIIDVHAHWGPWFFTMDVGTAATNLTLMDRYGIDLQLVSASEAVIYDPAGGNRRTAEFLEHDERLLGYLVINPRRLDIAQRDLAELLPGGRFVGVKIHTDYTASPLGSLQTTDALALAAEHGLPVLIHTWDAAVLDLAQACTDIPSLKAIAGHMGGPGWRHAIEAARGCPNLYLEPCFSHFEAGRVAAVAAAVDPGQLLFGTDATLIDPAVALGAVYAAELPPGVLDRLLWRNAVDLFGLHSLVRRIRDAHGPERLARTAD